MSETSKGLDAVAETNIGPDLFHYYIRGIQDLLSQDDNFLPFSSVPSDSVKAANEDFKNSGKNDNTGPVGFGSLFSNAPGAGLSDFQKERLKAMLRQSALALTREVDEMLDPVVGMRRLRRLMAQSNNGSGCEDESGNRGQKKLKITSSSSSIDIPLNTSPISCRLTREGSANGLKGAPVTGKSISSCCNRECVNFQITDIPKQITDPNEPKSLCGACKQANESSSNKDLNESFLQSDVKDDKDNGEVNEDLQVLLVNRGPKVDEKMEKYSAELSSKLDQMEEKVEELLDIVISSCRSMTLAEKHQLRRLIQKLPPENLDRVAQIMCRRKPSEKCCGDEISVDLLSEAMLISLVKD